MNTCRHSIVRLLLILSTAVAWAGPVTGAVPAKPATPRPLLLAASNSLLFLDQYPYWYFPNFPDAQSAPPLPSSQLMDPCRMAVGHCTEGFPLLPDTLWPPPPWLRAPLTLDARLQASLIWDDPEGEGVPVLQNRDAIQAAKAEAARLGLAFAERVHATRPALRLPHAGYPELLPHVLLALEYEAADVEEERLRAQASMVRADALEARWELRQFHSAGARRLAGLRYRERQAALRQLHAQLRLMKAESPLPRGLQQDEADRARDDSRAQDAALKEAEGERVPERQAENRQAFAALSAAVAGNMAALRDNQALRHELKRETLRPALRILTQSPGAASLPACKGGAGECIPDAPPAFRSRGGQRELRSLAPGKTTDRLAIPLEPLAVQGLARVEKLPAPKLAFLPQIQQKRALLIGINNYQDRDIPALESAVRDVGAVGKSLADKLGYRVDTVRDANRADIVDAIVRLAGETTAEDSVVLYYAGHGFLDEDTGKGYWIPADGRADTPEKWISNQDVGRLLSLIPARQLILVSDSCYSGSLAREHVLKEGELGRSTREVLARRSVIVMSSGGEEPVSDEGRDGFSIFAWSMQQTLQNVTRVSAGGKLFGEIRTRVMESYPQTPQYGAAVSAGHQEGGDYLFERRVYR